MHVYTYTPHSHICMNVCVCESIYLHNDQSTHAFRIRIAASKPPPQSESGVAEVKEESRHTSRVFIPITEGYDSRHITCLSHLKMFVESMSSTTRCVRKLQDGYVCGGTYKIRAVVRKGVGGELLAQASCTRCNFKVNYGDPGFSPSSSLPTKISIGRELVLSYILVGRPLHTWYEKMFGSFGMDS